MGLRHRVREDPRLLRRLVRLVVGVLSRELRRQAHVHRSRRDQVAGAHPGVVAAWQTHGDTLNFHPHVHMIATDGVFVPEAGFYGYLEWDAGRLTALWRDAVLASFTRLGLLTPQSAERLRSLPVERCGFHVHVETRVEPEDRERLRTLVRYLTRPPVALDRLHYSEGSGAVHYRTRKGADLHFLHAIDFLADLCQHIPPPGRPMLSYHGHFANALGRLESRSPTPRSPRPPGPRARSPGPA